MRTGGLKGALSPRLVVISIAVLLLAMTLAFIGSSSGTHDATVSMVPINSKAGENIGYTLTVTNVSGDNIDNVTLEVPLDEGGNARYRVATPVPAPENWRSELPENDGFGYAKKITWWTYNAHIPTSSSEDFTFTATTPLYDRTDNWTCRTSDVSGYVDNDLVTTRVDNMPPGSPTLVWPSNDENINDNTPNLDWNPVSDPSVPVTYDLLVDNDPDFLSPEMDVTGIVTDDYLTAALGESTWNWKVRAVDNAGNIGPWSSPRSFRVDITPPEPPTDVWPADGENINDNTPNLDWDAVTENSLPLTYDLMFEWWKRRLVTISGSHPENYQLKVVLPFYDNTIRFLENENAGVLPYWIENYTNDNMTVWVRRLENLDSSIWVYYDSGAGSVSNGDNTFVFFDNFDTYDTNKWTTVSGSPSVSGGILDLYDSGTKERIRTNTAQFGTDNAIRLMANFTVGDSQVGFANYFTDMSDATYTVVGSPIIASNQLNLRTRAGGSATNSYGTWSIWNTYAVYEIIRNDTDNAMFYGNNNLVTVNSTNLPTGNLNAGLQAPAGWHFYVDWFVVRRYSFPEPIASVGSEEISAQTGITDDNYQITTELSEGIWNWKVRVVDNAGNIGVWSPLRSFRVDITPPLSPTLLSPADKTKTSDNTPTFGWIAITIEDSLPATCDLQVDNDNNFLSPEENVTGLTENTYTPPSELPNGNYSWHVRARDNAGNVGPWSSTWTLLLNSTPHDATVVLAPINSKPGISIDYTLTVTDNATGDNIDNVTLEVPLDENGNALYHVVPPIPAPAGWTSGVPTIDGLGYATKVRWLADNPGAHIAAGESENFTFTATTPENDNVYTWTCLTRDIIGYIDNDSITTRVATTAWQLIETWTGAIEAPAAWQLVETWTGTIETPPWTGTAFFSLKNLYTVDVEKILDLYQGSKLVVKFYNYGDPFENENVIENFSPPLHVEENESARHPEGIGVKKVRLDLTTDDTDNVISTIASFTVRRVDLEARFLEIPFYWSQADAAGKLELEAEFLEIPFYWSGAPD